MKFVTELSANAIDHVSSDGQFDILINNAGINKALTIAETTTQDYDELFQVNVKTVFMSCQRLIPRIRDHGRIINLSSGLSRFSYPQYLAYSMTKGAIDVMTRVLAKELGARHITVNAIAPGPIDTDMNAGYMKSPEARAHIASQTSIPRIGIADDIAAAMALIAAPESGWITGQRIEASGGIHL